MGFDKQIKLIMVTLQHNLSKARKTQRHKCVNTKAYVPISVES